MSTSTAFQVEVLSPNKTLLKKEVNEVVLPAFDGEVGVLAHHENFLGVLGTGALKYVVGGDDHWLMVSDGFYRVDNGVLKILAERAETAKDIDVNRAKERVLEIEKLLSNSESSMAPSEINKLRQEHLLEKSRLDVHRRTEIVH
jgi:F-type H+-transporting ATPase subunit epsilon